MMTGMLYVSLLRQTAQTGRIDGKESCCSVDDVDFDVDGLG